MLLYIHGFNSSASSFKAQLVRVRMGELGREDEFICPDLPHPPREAIALLETFVRDAGDGLCLVGSSLGGFYATWLAEKHGLRAVLVNPAIRPYDLLQTAIGPQTNLYTGAQYELTRSHIEELRTLEVNRITPERYLLIVTTGDEVLDYRDAIAKYGGAKHVVVPGGDHGFGSFGEHVDTALSFCCA